MENSQKNYYFYICSITRMVIVTEWGNSQIQCTLKDDIYFLQAMSVTQNRHIL